MSLGPKALLLTSLLAGVGGTVLEHVDAGVFLALVGQFGAIVWWGARMQTQQKADRKLAEEEMAEVRRDAEAIETRLTQIERHGSVEVGHLLRAVNKLTGMVEDVQNRLTRVEAMCAVRHYDRLGEGLR